MELSNIYRGKALNSIKMKRIFASGVHGEETDLQTYEPDDWHRELDEFAGVA